jgi:hypothetical protein
MMWVFGLRVYGFTGLRVCGFAGLRVSGLRVGAYAPTKVQNFIKQHPRQNGRYVEGVWFVLDFFPGLRNYKKLIFSAKMQVIEKILRSRKKNL